MNSHLISLLKGVSWRIFGTIISVVIALLYLGSMEKALAIGALEFIFKVVLFYFHERMWLKVPVKQYE
jgi:uncharacterized membrane protein